MKIIPLAALVTIALLGGCEERQNPLAKMDNEDLVTWLKDRPASVREQMKQCGVFWASVSGTQYPANSRADCNDLASKLAAEMSAAGFGNVLPDDVPLPTLWSAYGKREINVYDPSKAAESIR